MTIDDSVLRKIRKCLALAASDNAGTDANPARGEAPFQGLNSR